MQLLGLSLEIFMVSDMQVEVLALLGYLICKSESLEMQLGVLPCRCRYLRSIVDFLQSCNLILDNTYLFLVIFNFFMLHLQLLPQRPLSLTHHQLTFIAINHLQSQLNFIHYLLLIYFRLIDHLLRLCDIGIDSLLADQSALTGL